jgi:hypothetical protein
MLGLLPAFLVDFVPLFDYILHFAHLYGFITLCRKALTGILEKGGFPLLYAGWGAVLCRNVPQSVIKVHVFLN